jgi:hypothetical protein
MYGPVFCKSRGAGSVTVDKPWYNHYSHAPLVEEYSFSFTDYVETEQTCGDRIDHFYRRRERGDLLPHTAFRQTLISGSRTGGSAQNVYNNQNPLTRKIIRQEWPEWSKDYWIIDGSDFSEYMVDAEAYVQQAAAGIYSQGADVLTMAAEAHKTIDSFRRVTRGLHKILKYRKFGHKFLGDTAQAWLGGRYEVRTTAYDVVDLYNSIARWKDRRRWSNRAGTSTNLVADKSFDTTSPNAYIQHVSLTDSVTIGVRGAVTADVIVSRFVANPIKTAWELIPWSFIADWYINMGTFIDAMSLLAVNSQYTASKGWEIVIERSMSVNLENLSTVSVFTGNCGGSCYGKYQHRDPCSISTRPQWRLNTNVDKQRDVAFMLAGVR